MNYIKIIDYERDYNREIKLKILILQIILKYIIFIYLKISYYTLMKKLYT